MTEQREREEFEAWSSRRILHSKSEAWQSWQGRAALSQPQSQAQGEAVPYAYEVQTAGEESELVYAAYLDRHGAQMEYESRIPLYATPVAAQGEAVTDAQMAEQPSRYAINGAIARGRMGTGEPPTGHWLTEYWHIGRQLAKLGELSPGAQPQTHLQKWSHVIEQLPVSRDDAPAPSSSLELSDMQDFIAGVMQKWVGSNGGIYALHGCALEVAKAILARGASPSASPAALTDDEAWAKWDRIRATKEATPKELIGIFARALLASQPSEARDAVDLIDLRKRLLTPREIVRDEDGLLVNPALPILDESDDVRMFLAAFGVECCTVSMESDCDDEALRDAVWAGEKGCGEWTPTPPDGEGWILSDIYDTEDGPSALFIRQKPKDPGMSRRERQAACATDSAAARDAERYRWLRDSDRLGDDDLDGNIVVGEAGAESLLWGEQLDRAIDAALAAQREGGA